MVTDQELDRAASIIRSGGLVALPTETVYGLAADALNPAAVARIYAVKGRPATSPLIVHVSDFEMARSLVTAWPPAAEALARRFWPGPLTLVLPKQPRVPDIVTSGLGTVAIRMPSHPAALEVIRRAGTPIAAPSANRFTQLSPTTADHVRHALESDVDMILDGGPCAVGIESTVVAPGESTITLLRPGVITAGEIGEMTGLAVHAAGAVEGAHPSPGMHQRHYAPRTPLIEAKDALPPGRGAMLWWRTPRKAALAIAMPADPLAYARELYSALHRADDAHLDWIAIEPVPATHPWAAVRDRIRRALQDAPEPEP